MTISVHCARVRRAVAVAVAVLVGTAGCLPVPPATSSTAPVPPTTSSQTTPPPTPTDSTAQPTGGPITVEEATVVVEALQDGFLTMVNGRNPDPELVADMADETVTDELVESAEELMFAGVTFEQGWTNTSIVAVGTPTTTSIDLEVCELANSIEYDGVSVSSISSAPRLVTVSRATSDPLLVTSWEFGPDEPC